MDWIELDLIGLNYIRLDSIHEFMDCTGLGQQKLTMSQLWDIRLSLRHMAMRQRRQPCGCLPRLKALIGWCQIILLGDAVRPKFHLARLDSTRHDSTRSTLSSESSQSNESRRAGRAAKNAWARHVERVESSRDEPSGI